MSEITYIVPMHDKLTYETFIKNSIKKYGGRAMEMNNEDPNIPESIFVKYKTAMDVLVSSDLNDDDIFVFVHEDVGIVDEFFNEKVKTIFDSRKDVGIVGIAGTSVLEQNGAWWHTNQENLRGHLVQGNGTDSKGSYLKKGKVGFFDDVVAVDGCILITTGKMIRDVFKLDMELFKECNDFYDIEMCMQVLEAGYKVAVADIFIFHRSVGGGSLGNSWKITRDKLIGKYIEKGYSFPLTIESFKEKMTDGWTKHAELKI